MNLFEDIINNRRAATLALINTVSAKLPEIVSMIKYEFSRTNEDSVSIELPGISKEEFEVIVSLLKMDHGLNAEVCSSSRLQVLLPCSTIDYFCATR